MSLKKKYFNVRVYGLLIRDEKILVSDEFIRGKEITKLPGGGLEFGEGTKECVIREFEEELKIKIKVKNHFYTTDFFINSAFNPDSQLISIYYEVEPLEEVNIPTSHRKFDFGVKKEGSQSFRWLLINKITDKDFTFSIDKLIGLMLKEKFKSNNE